MTEYEFSGVSAADLCFRQCHSAIVLPQAVARLHSERESGIMLPKFKTNHVWFQDWRLVLCLVLILVGIIFRFGNLNQVYWHDEAYTSLRMAGYTALEVKQKLFTGKPLTVEDIKYFQWPNPERSAVDTVRSLAIDDAQHPPIYYVLVRQWVGAFGNSIWIARSLSASIGVLAFPAMYWLCQELFAVSGKPVQFSPTQRRLTAGIAMALVAISPFHILYAQEAREYSLWTVLILVLSAEFLRAVRLNRWQDWGLYTAVLVVSLYTQPFSALVALGQGVYVVIVEHFRLTKRAIAFLLCLAVGLVAFAPWLLIIIKSWGQTGLNWTAQPIPFSILLKMWGLHIVRCFILTQGDFNFDIWQIYLLLPAMLTLSSYALYFICRNAPLKTWLFLITLIGASFLPLALPDLIFGGQRSTAGRYLIPAILGLQMAIALLLANQICTKVKIKRQFWQGVTAFLIVISMLSGIETLTAKTSWPKVVNYNLPLLSQVVNVSPKPLLIGSSRDISFGTILALSHLLDPKVKLLMIDDSYTPNTSLPSVLPKGFTDIFLLNPSETLRTKIEQQENVKASLMFNDFHLYLWRIL